MKKILILTVVILGILLQGCILVKKRDCYDPHRFYKKSKSNRHIMRKQLRNDYRYHQVRPNNPVLNLFRRKP